MVNVNVPLDCMLVHPHLRINAQARTVTGNQTKHHLVQVFAKNGIGTSTDDLIKDPVPR